MPGEVERLRAGMRLVSSAIAAFSEATSDYGRLLETVARNVAEVIGDTCVVLLKQPNGELLPASIYDLDPAVSAELWSSLSEPHRPLSDRILSAIRPILTPVMDLEAIRVHVPPARFALFERLGLHGEVIASMRVRGEAIGGIAVLRHRAERRPLDEVDAELLQDLATHAGLAIFNARYLEALREHEELRRAKAATDEANRFLDAVIEHLPDMVFVKDATHLAFTRFNRAGELLLGLTRDQLLGRTDLDLFPPAEATFFQAKDRETLAGGVMVEILEEPIATAHGTRWLHTKKVPILGEDGTARYLLGISHDITDRKRTDSELRTAKEQAERAAKELEAFSYSVAHDLRAPLRGIDGFSQALLEDYGDKLDDVGRRYLQRVRQSAQRMAVLIDDLLALSKIVQGDLRLTRCDLSALVQAAVAALQRLDPDRHVEVVIQPGLEVMADARLLSIALDNLLGNAWKFTRKTEHARIEVAAVEREGKLTYVVRDNGVGFEMMYASKLFGVFQRLHHESEFEGTGIGLATVARIIHRHQGRVSAEGAPGRGAQFFFTLGSEAE